MFSVNYEPVRLAALIRSVVFLLTAFGLELTPVQIGAIQVVAEMVLVPVVRNKVTPAVKVAGQIDEAVTRAAAFHSHRGV